MYSASEVIRHAGAI